MAPLTQFALAVLATASIARAQPGHKHRHLHNKRSASTAPYSYANTTVVVTEAVTGVDVTSDSTYTSTSTYTETITSTIIDYVTDAGSAGTTDAAAAAATGAAAGAGAGASGASEGQCGGSITVTVTVTDTVTGGASSTSSALASLGNKNHVDTDTYEPATTSAAAPAATTTAAPAPASPAPATNEPDTSPAAAPSSSAAAPASAPTGSYSGSGVQAPALSTKRGCLYNYEMTSGCSILGAGETYISWSANWASSSGWENASIDNFFYETPGSYVPQLWGLNSQSLESWAANAASIAEASVIMGYNEPDCSGQSNLAAAAAAAQWDLVYKFAGSGKTIISPCVTSTIASSGEFTGLQWLESFAEAGAEWDATGIHFYADCSQSADNQVGYLKSFVSAVSTQFPKPIWVTEYGCSLGASPEQIGDFLTAAGDYLESESAVAHYAAFMASDGILLTGNAPNAAGQAYVASKSS